MLYKKKGLPEENELVTCTVKKILFHSIFATLEEYEKLDGMIHISEIAPGRIRNIRDYVREGKRVVCVVLKVNRENGHIDLSLRRVSMSLRNKKNEEFKQEMKAEKLLENIGFQLKVKLPEVYKKIGYKLVEKYDLLFPALVDIASNGESAIQDLKLDPNYSKLLLELVKERIKPPEFEMHEKLTLQTFSPNGIDDIKDVLKTSQDFAKKKEYDFNLVYISAPLYRVEVKAGDKKTASDNLKKLVSTLLKEAKKKKIEAKVIAKKWEFYTVKNVKSLLWNKLVVVEIRQNNPNQLNSALKINGVNTEGLPRNNNLYKATFLFL